jgi:hypothetical protein
MFTRTSIRRAVAVGAAAAGLLLLALPTAGTAAPATAPAGLDHFQCYLLQAANSTAFKPPAVKLTDEFGTITVNPAKKGNLLCNPVQKTRSDTGVVTPINNPNAHLVCYKVTTPTVTPHVVVVTNQFGSARLTIGAVTRLCLPSWKVFTPPVPTGAPPGLDHFLCYKASYTLTATGTPVQKFKSIPPAVNLADEFGTSTSKIHAPVELCNPVQKERLDNGQVTPITNPQAHLVCMKLDPLTLSKAVLAGNQFGVANLLATSRTTLCLPSFKDIIS